MNLTAPLLLGQLTERIRGIREHYPGGESIGAAVMVLLVIAGIVIVTWLLARRQQRRPETWVAGDPHRLFADLMRAMMLTFPQRQLLRSMARVTELENPCVLLLSPALFEAAVARIGRDRINAAYRAKLVSQLRGRLFGQS